MGGNESKPKKVRISYDKICDDNIQPIIQSNTDINNINITYYTILHKLDYTVLEIVAEKYLPKIAQYALENSIKIDEESIKKIVMMYDINIIKLLEKNYNLNLINYTSLVLQNNKHIDVSVYFINMNPTMLKSFFENVVLKSSIIYPNRMDKLSYVIASMILKGYTMTPEDLQMTINAQAGASLSVFTKHDTIVESARIYVRDHTCQICQARYVRPMEKECDECKNIIAVTKLKNKLNE